MAYDNNISPGNPPLIWSDVKSAFDQINENFTVLGSALARNTPVNIAHIELTDPVRVVTTNQHDFLSAARGTITETGISQLDNNTYYIKVISNDEVELYSDESLTSAIDGSAFDAYSSGGGKIQTTSGFAAIDFSNFYDNLIPATTDTYRLGDFSRTWKRLNLSAFSEGVEGGEQNGLWLGTAHVINDGASVVLPADSRVGNDLIIDPENTFFKFINVDDAFTFEADGFRDTLNLYSGTAIEVVAVTDDFLGTNSITFNNTGVTSLIAGTGTSVSSETGNVTVTNTGVITLTNGSTLPAGLPAGSGISVSSAAGNITVTNTGVLDIQNGFGITVSRDDATGIVTVTNNAPAQVAYRTVRVDGSSDLVADSTSDILIVEAGYGMVITTTELVDDTLVLAVDQNIDIYGSVFANDSSIIVDSIDQKIYASGGITGNLTGDTTGYHTGDITGSVFADNSTKLVDAVEGLIVGPVVTPSLSIDGTFNFDTSGAFSQLATMQVPSGGSLSINQDTAPVYFNGSGEDKIVTIQDGDITANTIFVPIIDTTDSSAITVVPPVNFNTDVNFENELFIQNSRVIAIAELQTIVAASTDFANFQARIAAL